MSSSSSIVPIYIADAFTSKPFYGNSAAVCFLDANKTSSDVDEKSLWPESLYSSFFIISYPMFPIYQSSVSGFSFRRHHTPHDDPPIHTLYSTHGLCSDSVLQNLAKEMNLSETAFLIKDEV